ncbi:HvfC/BufC family peptide modification chaperone [Agarivorans sp. QJM3NY_33]|uniref:HvfC/BufC family peptide modification chaperone n=1 Tax=Agarivorans sp. QJM3NY_33 TaxID=3421432 RepID=UPI003D7EAACE
MLKQLQQQFSNALNHQENAIHQHLQQGQLTADESMQIYQNNYLLSLSEALSASYPTIQKLVGEEYFCQSAKRFILAKGHDQGDLNLFGQGFDLFLQQQPKLAELPYLPAVAQLDWLIEQTAGQALSSTFLSIAELQTIAPENLGSVVLHLAPQYTLLSSQYPIFDIYQMVQAEQVEAIELQQNDYLLLTKQANFEVAIEQISALSFEFLAHCHQQRPLEQLPEHCLFELEALLGDAIHQQRFASFSHANATGGPEHGNL